MTFELKLQENEDFMLTANGCTMYLLLTYSWHPAKGLAHITGIQ
jgi:hypothetical protein